MPRMTGYKRINENKKQSVGKRPSDVKLRWKTINVLAERGISNKIIAQMLGMHPMTVSRYRAAQTPEAYLEKSRQRNQAYRNKQDENAVQDAVYEPEVKEVFPQVLDNDIAADLGKALGNLADALLKQAASMDTMTEKMDEVLETKRPWLARARS